MFRYTEGNPCHEYRRGAVRSLLPKGTPSPDLDGLTSDGSNDRFPPRSFPLAVNPAT